METGTREAIGTALQEMLRARGAWDEPPALYYVIKTPTCLHVEEMPVPPAVWGIMEPGALLSRMGNASMRKGVPGLGLPEGCEYAGVAFRTETWAVCTQGPDEETLAMAEAHRLDEHPGRVEQRAVFCAVPDGFITATLARESGAEELDYSGAGPGGEKVEIEGRVARALARMLFALRGGIFLDG